ncbi:hypothetical protein OAO87_02460 [bacterium]|nr:hypothetical protein [bacterium]
MEVTVLLVASILRLLRSYAFRRYALPARSGALVTITNRFSVPENP